MNLEDLAKVISASDVENHFVIVLKNGKKIQKRMFVACNGQPCEFRYRSKTTGRYIDESEITEWESVKPKDEVNPYVRYRNFFKTCVKYLEESKLWPDMLADFKLVLSNEELFKFIVEKEKVTDYFEFNEKLRKFGMTSKYVDTFHRTIKKGIITINYVKCNKKCYSDLFNKSTETTIRWRKVYDCTLSKNDGKAWYSEEYKNTGNGHYYLALDANHAIFREDD